MAGRGGIACSRCKEVKRKDKMVQQMVKNYKIWLCKHCRAIMVYKLRQMEKIALLAD